MKPSELRSRTVGSDAQALIDLPVPGETELHAWTPKQQTKCMEWARACLLGLLVGIDDADHPPEFDDRRLSGAFAMTAMWFVALRVAHLSRVGTSPPVFSLDDAARLAAFCDGAARDGTMDSERATACFALMAYIKLLITAGEEVARISASLVGTSAHAAVESIGHEALLELHRTQSSAPTEELQLAAGVLLHQVLFERARISDEIARGRDESWRPGPYSELRLDELSLLAARHEATVRRYGARRVDKRFEQQLSLLFQSLGFIVVQTRTGSRTVDLVCVSGESRSTFLVEAKTSGAAYSLPAKDERALRDYIADVDETLKTLPPLRFVLLVSHSATRTLPGKLQALETKSGKPARFMSAAALSRLRTNLPGPTPAGVLEDHILASDDRVLPAGFVDDVVASYSKQQDAHRALVDSLFSLRSRQT